MQIPAVAGGKRTFSIRLTKEYRRHLPQCGPACRTTAGDELQIFRHNQNCAGVKMC